jgi:hypothetical protein
VNGIFLVCIAVAIVLEGVERLWEPPEINSENLLLVAILGFLVNMVGLVFFHDHHGHGHSHSHGGTGSCDHHKSENMQGSWGPWGTAFVAGSQRRHLPSIARLLFTPSSLLLLLLLLLLLPWQQASSCTYLRTH